MSIQGSNAHSFESPTNDRQTKGIRESLWNLSNERLRKTRKHILESGKQKKTKDIIHNTDISTDGSKLWMSLLSRQVN